MQPTEAQHQAIYTRENAIVVAGAGSGKTRVLVERYLTLLDENPDWSLNALVAITFTRKAAGEMRDRVRLSLEKKRYAAQLADNATAMQRWAGLLSQMDSARITTIHALCADLLRANAAEAGLDPDFVVLDETEAAILLRDVLEDAFTQVAFQGEALVDALRIFETYELRQVRETFERADWLGTGFEALPDDLMAHWQAQWSETCHTVSDAFLAHSGLLQRWNGIGSDSLSEKWAEVNARLQYLEQVEDWAACYNEIDTIGSIRKPGTITKSWGDDGATAKEDLCAIIDLAKAIIKEIGDPPGDDDRMAAALLPGWKQLIEHVQTAYSAAKTARAALDFDDLERLAAGLLLGNPAVVARYQQGEILHLLVDEFQDTNAAQWTIAEQLAGMERRGSLFLVGDPKQSIYAFRGADVSVFNRVRDQITQIGGAAAQINLARSFRTHAGLVNRFNALFAHILTVDDDNPVRAYSVDLGEPMDAQRASPPDGAPALELLLIDESAADEAGYKAEQCRQWEAREIALRLKALKREGRQVFDKEHGHVRPFEYGDAALLFQSTSHLSVYENALRAAGIPFITVGGRGYYGRQEVHDLLNLLRALYNPADHLALASALRSPLFSLSDDCLYALRLITRAEDSQPIPLWEALATPSELVPLGERDKVAFAHQTLRKLHALAGRVTISELLRAALAETGFLAVLTGLPDGAMRRGNVEKLLDKAQSSGKITLSDFTAYLSDLSEREVREGDAALDVAGVVQLMTVHASKGLEFPVVVLVEAHWKRGGGGRSADLLTFKDGFGCKVPLSDGKWGKPYAYQRAARLQALREDAERRRLLYVAATRAQDMLIVSGMAKPAKDDPERLQADGWLGWLIEALESSADSDLSDVALNLRRDPPTLRHRRDSDADDPESPLLFNTILPAKVASIMPPLLSAVRPRQQRQARHLAAASIADLGGSFQADDPAESQAARARFRRKVLYEAPSVIARVRPDSTYRLGAINVGDIVHEALRWWRLPFDTMDSNTQQDLLYSYAWENGVTDAEATRVAVERAQQLLTKFSQSALYRWTREAQAAGKPIYRELPFIYERDTHIVHGVIDILFQRANGTWVLADYKTSRIGRTARHGLGGGVQVYEALAVHARRYHLQVGVYAEAAQAQLNGILPSVFIHYISYATSVEIPTATWREALAAGLGTPIAQVMQSP